MSKTETGPQPVVCFAAIDPYIETNIVPPTERSLSGTERVLWGPSDKYPGYIMDLYEGCPTLRSVISGCVDFITGDDVLFRGNSSTVMNANGDRPRDVVADIALSIERLGGLAINVVRGLDGKPIHVYGLDVSTIRSNKDNTVFWYSKKWGKYNPDPVRLPAFMPKLTGEWSTMDEQARKEAASSLLFIKGDKMHVYPSPCFSAAVKACETERSIDDYHLNSLENGFAASAIINFNNGIPSDEQKKEIEKDIYEKFAGHTNAARIAVNFSPSKDNMAVIQTLKTEDFGERYAALAKHCRQQIYTAFRANPNLFGIPTESLGFSSEEYDAAFKLFNRTHIRPIQRLITDAFEYIFGESVLEIKPFTLDGAGEATVQ